VIVTHLFHFVYRIHAQYYRPLSCMLLILSSSNSDCCKLIFSVYLFWFGLRNAINTRKAAFATAASLIHERADVRDYALHLGYLYLHLPFLVY
jgi:hypothetical protein